MIYISGMEDGSGSGEAASRKAGWLRGGAPGGAVLRSAAQSAAAQLLDALNTALANRNRGNATPPPAPPLPGRSVPRSTAPENRPRRPEFSADGRPLPPDGSAPVPRSRPTAERRQQTARATAANSAPPAAADSSRAPAEFDAAGRPLPPDGSAPPARPGSAPVGAPAATTPAQLARRTPLRTAASGSTPARVAAPRVAGTPLPPGAAPSAPQGHRFVARPAPAPPGEFLFEVRCSCGAAVLAPVKLGDLRRAAALGHSPAAAIAIATQDALDAMHAGHGTAEGG